MRALAFLALAGTSALVWRRAARSTHPDLWRAAALAAFVFLVTGAEIVP